jgi:hypothetical protein
MNNSGKEEKPNSEAASLGLIFDPMEQMRELLFGATKRETERQLSVLEAKLDDVRAELLARIESLDNRVSDLARDTEKSQTESILAIGGAISDLGDRIKIMAAKRKV